MTAYANVDGETVIEGTLHVPNVGPWWADVVFELAPDLSGSVTLNIGPLALSGTIDATHDGTFGRQRRSRIVAGGGGWGTLVPAQAYHNDGGVRALSVAQDAARLASETLNEASFNPEAATVGADYVRQATAASRALEDVIGSTPWHVDYQGRTNVGPRTTSEADVDDYEVLDVDPGESLVTLAIDDLRTVGIGSILSERLDAPVTVFELRVSIGAEASRTVVWGGGSEGGRGRLTGALRKIVKSIVDERLPYKYRYRVVAMDGDRVQLQAVVAAAGLPDILPVSQKPGVSGAHAKLVGGSIVLVEFIEGLRTLPILVAYASKGEEGHAPDELDLSVVSTLRLGDDTATSKVALAPSIDSQFDTINIALDAFAAAAPVTGDGGAVIHTAFKTPWGAPKASSDVGASKVVAI